MNGRSALLAGLAAAAALVAWSVWFAPRRVVLRRRTLRLPHWPPELAGLRVAVLADLHAGAPHVDEDKVARLVADVNRARPDLVALLGDYVDPTVAFGTRVAPAAVAAQLGHLRAPLGVLAVLGNHDWAHVGAHMGRCLRDAGVIVLENDAVAVRDGLWVAGVGAETERRADPLAALAAVPDHDAVLLLSHNPDTFVRVPDRVALTLSGHTHAGQVALPYVRARYIPSRFGERFAAGHLVERGRHLFVSAGVGTSRLPIRFLAPPEIVVLRIEPGRRREIRGRRRRRAGSRGAMSPEHIKRETVDRPEPDEALSDAPARTREHEPSDDDREVVLDDPALPEVAIDDDDRDSAARGDSMAD